MKASNFSIGNFGTIIINPNPIMPIETNILSPSFDIKEQKQKLSQTSWING